jgi:hypothetical protein
VLSGVGGNGGNGAAATSTATGSNVGTQAIPCCYPGYQNYSVAVTSTANGGNGGSGSGSGINGRGGDAISHASATSTAGSVNAQARSTGGTGSGAPSVVKADALARGGLGSYAYSLAKQTGTQITSEASVSSTGSGLSDTAAAIGQPAPAASTSFGKEAVAFGTALPQTADVNTALVTSPNVHHNFDVGGNSQGWLLGNLGVLNTSAVAGFHDYHAKLDINLDTSPYTNPQHLLLGLLNPGFGSTNLGTGDTLNFSINISGASGSYSKTYSFTDLSNAADPNSAFNFFHDKTLDLGTWASFLTGTNKALDIAFAFDMHTHTIGTGMNVGLIAGNSTLESGPVPTPTSVPLPTPALWLFGFLLAGISVAARRQPVAA